MQRSFLFIKGAAVSDLVPALGREQLRSPFRAGGTVSFTKQSWRLISKPGAWQAQRAPTARRPVGSTAGPQPSASDAWSSSPRTFRWLLHITLPSSLCATRLCWAVTTYRTSFVHKNLFSH